MCMDLVKGRKADYWCASGGPHDDVSVLAVLKCALQFLMLQLLPASYCQHDCLL